MTNKKFKVVSNFQPTGDQPQAIESLAEGLGDGLSAQVLLGATGTGKTFTIAKVIELVQLPTIVIAHNKTIAAQLAAQTVKVAAKVSETGRIYGSVTAAQLAEALNAAGIAVDKKDITITSEEVKELGTFEAVVKLYKGIKAAFNFEVVAE